MSSNPSGWMVPVSRSTGADTVDDRDVARIQPRRTAA
jgi:hypothetical protein